MARLQQLSQVAGVLRVARAGLGPLLQEVQWNEIEVCSGWGSAEPEVGPG